MKVIDAALRYSKRGLYVFPVPPNTKRSYKSSANNGGRPWGATKDPDEILRDWQRWPDAGIGIPTGAVNGIVVIETDTVEGHGVDGALSLRQLEAEYGSLPETLQSLSPSGSIHRYFRHPGNDIKIKSSASEIGAGIDVRADGGMVVAPPTVKNGRAYRWIVKKPRAPMPDWLIELTRHKPFVYVPPSRPITLSEGKGYGAAALQREVDALINTAPGSRNDALNRASFSLHQLVAGGELSRTEVERQLIEAATINGLVADTGMHDVLKTIRSGANAGLQHPRGRR